MYAVRHENDAQATKLSAMTTASGGYHRNDSFFFNYDCFQCFAAVQYCRLVQPGMAMPSHTQPTDDTIQE